MAGAIYSDHPIPILPVGLARTRICRRSATSMILATRRWLAYAALVVAVLGITWSAVFVRWAAVSGPASAFYRVFIPAIVPLTALLFVPLLGEPLNAAQLAGGALVLAGIFVVNRAPSLKNR
jgi:drug/metabolite transporter (DMT)-like permease